MDMDRKEIEFRCKQVKKRMYTLRQESNKIQMRWTFFIRKSVSDSFELRNPSTGKLELPFTD